MVLIKNFEFFHFLVLSNICKENVFYDILETKNAFLGLKNNKLKKVEKLTFFQRVKQSPFFQLFFLGNIGQENVFYDILETKNAFLGYKNNKLETSRKIDIFAKGITHGFVQKNGHFFNFFLANKGQDNVFHDILETKNAFLGYKNNKLKKVGKLTFFQRGYPMVFVKERPFFQLLFF